MEALVQDAEEIALIWLSDRSSSVDQLLRHSEVMSVLQPLRVVTNKLKEVLEQVQVELDGGGRLSINETSLLRQLLVEDNRPLSDTLPSRMTQTLDRFEGLVNPQKRGPKGKASPRTARAVDALIKSWKKHIQSYAAATGPSGRKPRNPDGFYEHLLRELQVSLSAPMFMKSAGFWPSSDVEQFKTECMKDFAAGLERQKAKREV